MENDAWKPTSTLTGHCINVNGRNSPECNDLFIFFSTNDPHTSLGLEYEKTQLETYVFILASPHSAPLTIIGSEKEQLVSTRQKVDYIIDTNQHLPCLNTETLLRPQPPYNNQLCRHHQCILQVSTDLLICALPSYSPHPLVDLCQTQDQ